MLYHIFLIFLMLVLILLLACLVDTAEIGRSIIIIIFIIIIIIIFSEEHLYALPRWFVMPSDKIFLSHMVQKY